MRAAKLKILKLIFVVMLTPLMTSTTPLENLRKLDGLEFADATRFVVEAPLTLTTSTNISSDEVLITHPIVTMGHSLSIETRRLIFEGGGKIIAFPAGSEGAAAPAGQVGGIGKHGTDGHVTYDTGKTKKVRRLRRSIDGNLETYEVDVPIKFTRGEEGGQGSDGNRAEIPASPGADAGEINISAAKVEGTLVVDGRGQKGGRGGQGGTGGKGGNGAPGRNGIAGYFGFGGRDPSDGGLGGRGGNGGNGGNGGSGGRGAVIRIQVASELNSPSILVDGGFGGDSGAGGEVGEGGKGGGKGGPAKGFLVVIRTASGSADTDGLDGNDTKALHYPNQALPNDGKAGNHGLAGTAGSTAVLLVPDLESARLNAVNAFLEFQLERNFWALVEKTYAQVEDALVIGSLQESLTRSFISTEASQLHNASLTEGEKLAYFSRAWSVFDEVFKDLDQGDASMKSLSESYRQVKASLEILRSAQTSETHLLKAQESLDRLSFRRFSRFRASFVRMSQACEIFLSRLSEEWKAASSNGWLLNRHFVVPGCLELDRIEASPLRPIVIQSSGDLLVSPGKLRSHLKTQEVELYATKLKNPFSFLRYAWPSAYALANMNDDALNGDIVWSVENLNKISLEHIASAYLNHNVVGRSGIPTALRSLVFEMVKNPGDVEVLAIINAASWNAIFTKRGAR